VRQSGNVDIITQAGAQMGLKVILDAHTDILAEYSITEDFEGFSVIITPPSDFPLMEQEGFGIKTGERNSKFKL
jgi:hypothetical protein